MELSQRFLNFVQQQLNSFEYEAGIKRLAVYVAHSNNEDAPTLQAIGQWPNDEKALPPVEAEPELRMPSPDRRWYPIQQESILLGVLRVETKESDEIWSDSLDIRLKASANAIGQCLGLEIEKKRAFEQLNRQREQISLMIHQLRNPLSALRTYAQLLLRKLGPDNTHINLVEGLISEQEQLNRYVLALDELSELKLSSNEEIKKSLLLPPVLSQGSLVNLKLLLEPLLERASATANLQSREWFGPDIWPNWSVQNLSAKYGVIPEIVANLLENAFRYSSPNASIGIYFNESGLCVWDSGDEIIALERERIFEKGFRGKASHDNSGSGLGLAVGRQLSYQLGGDLQLIIPPSNIDKSLSKKGNAFFLSFAIAE